MKLFAIFWFTHLILVDKSLCDRTGEAFFSIKEKPFTHSFSSLTKNPTMRSMAIQNIMRRIKQPEFNNRINCFLTDENDENCAFQKNEIRQNIAKNTEDPSFLDILRARQKILVAIPETPESVESETNEKNLNSSKTEQLSLTAEEPRFVIIRKEHEFPLKLDARNFWEFIPPRGRKANFDLNDDMFIPNRGKKTPLEYRDKKVKQNQIAFELNDDFYPVRGRRLPNNVPGSSKQALYDEDLFYPNRGKRLI